MIGVQRSARIPEPRRSAMRGFTFTRATEAYLPEGSIEVIKRADVAASVGKVRLCLR